MIVERHMDYQLTVASVPVGGMPEVPLRLDSDAPFSLRLVRSRNLGASGFRFQTPRRQWQSSGLRTDLTVNPTLGTFPSRGVVVYPQMTYSPGASIVCQLGNATLAPLTNVRLLFRGSKLFEVSDQDASTYPTRLASLPFIYPSGDLFNFQTAIQFPTLTGTLRDLQLRVRNDADYVLRYAVCDPFTLLVDGLLTSYGAVTPPAYQELYITLRDEARKPYSNEPIHINDLCGQGLPTPFGSGANDDRALWMPGLFTPEIYIRRDGALYFDLLRNDTAATGSAPLDLHFRWGGAKVFPR